MLVDPVSILNTIRVPLENSGFQCYLFNVDWYNAHVNESFTLHYPPGSLGILVISLPSMFERTFLPWLRRTQGNTMQLKDPLDHCMREYFSTITQAFAGDCETIFDYDLVPNKRRPRIIMQVAAHVSGAAYYYRRHELLEDPFDANAKIFGVCLHPLYGGWFAMRAVLIFPQVQAQELVPKDPVKQLQSDEQIAELLRRFNSNWRDGTYRDMVRSVERYSEKQQLYFNTKPVERFALVQRWLLEFDESQETQAAI